MLIFLSLLICIALVTAFVIVLRRHHQKAFALAAEREQALPSLTNGGLELAQLMPEEIADPWLLEDAPLQNDTAPQTADSPLTAPDAPAAIALHDERATQDEHVAQNDSAAPARQEHSTSPDDNVLQNASLPSPPAPAPAPPQGDWKQRALYWRDRGEYEEALACCGEAWPQWQSYQQAAVVMRTAIRHASNDDEHRDWYDRLYHLAVQASLLHDRIEGLPELTRQQMAANFTRDDLDALGLPWADVGCNRLRLLTKADRRNLTALYNPLYGAPAEHRSAKVWFQHLL